MRVLNLYAGIGGNRKLWEDVEVTAVEMETEIADVYSKNFPSDSVVIGDAHLYLLGFSHNYDFIWSSPPCQTHSRMMKATRHPQKRYPDMALYQEIIFLKHFFKGLWVVENVKPYYEPLIPPSKIIGRHYFWSNFQIGDIEVKNHKNFIKADSKQEIEAMKKRIGITYEGNIYYKDNHSPGQILRNCVLPEVGKHILDCAIGKADKQEKQLSLQLTNI